jgi:hypothetical protein
MKKMSKGISYSILEKPDFNGSETIELEQLSILAGHWQSDLKFYQDEIRFLRNLIVRYFMWLSDDKNLSDARQVAKQLTSLEGQRSVCEQGVNTHLQHYVELIQNPFTHDSHDFGDEHQRMEKAIADFVKAFKATKAKTFELTEHIIESEKVKHLIESN